MNKSKFNMYSPDQVIAKCNEDQIERIRMSLNKKEYIEKVSKFTEDEVWIEISSVCRQAKLEHDYLMFRDTGGLSWTLDKIASDLYLTSKPIDEEIRFKLYVLCIGLDVQESFYDLYAINKKLKEETNSWQLERAKEQVEKCRKKFKRNLRCHNYY